MKKNNGRKTVDKIAIIIIVMFSCIILFFIINFFKKLVNGEYDTNEEKQIYKEKIVYKIPKKFEKIYDDYYNYDTDDVYCSINITETEKSLYYNSYTSLDEYLKNNITIHLSDQVSDMEELKINNNKVLYLSVKTKNEIVYYYGVEGTEKYYMLEYKIHDYKKGDRKDIDTNICYTAKDKILNSIEIKK